MTEFLGNNPTLENYWRSIILYGNNVACYKFALGKALLEIALTGKTFVTLEELAEPFSRHITEHLKLAGKQTTSNSSRFLSMCDRFNQGEISQDELIATTVRLGFENVIDAFHNVNKSELPVRFFTDERSSQKKGIALTDNLLELPELYQGQNLPQEVEARWRLVETAWELKISKHLIKVDYDHQEGKIFTLGDRHRRVDVTSCRDALNGYQKGKCFYCFADISIFSGSSDLGDVEMKTQHNKLVRDKIPEIIRNSGNQCEIEALSNLEYIEALKEKLVEEAKEAAIAKPEELSQELADVYEVIEALMTATGINRETVITKQKQKYRERGGFQGRIKLLWTKTSKTNYK